MITPALAIGALERAAGILVKRLEELERRVEDGDLTASEPLERAATALAVVLPHPAPERRGALSAPRRAGFVSVPILCPPRPRTSPSGPTGTNDRR
jgi:hypothetical protein